MSESLLELDDIFWKLDSIIRLNPELLKKVSPKWKKLEATARRVLRVHKLQGMPDWASCPQAVLLELTTEESEPFVQVALGLATRKFRVNQVSLVLWWRRLVATGNAAILTYFGWDHFEVEGIVTGQDLLRQCTKNEDILKNITEALKSDTTVDYRIRELLGGLSKQSDVKAAWKKWCMTNHPDKGGDAENFLRVKLVYEEWLDSAGRTNADAVH